VAHSPVRSVSTTVAPPENVHRVATSECRWAWRETQRRGTWSSGSGPEHLSGDRDPSFRLHTGFPPHSPLPLRSSHPLLALSTSREIQPYGTRPWLAEEPLRRGGARTPRLATAKRRQIRAPRRWGRGRWSGGSGPGVRVVRGNSRELRGCPVAIGGVDVGNSGAPALVGGYILVNYEVLTCAECLLSTAVRSFSRFYELEMCSAISD
jgi:hypothetical protein